MLVSLQYPPKFINGGVRRPENTFSIFLGNRLVITNPGYSLKPPEQPGEPDSVPRNKVIAAVLHDTHFAKTKGSGIQSMRRYLQQAGLSVPLFDSDRYRDHFRSTYLLHHFLSEDDLGWLKFSINQMPSHPDQSYQTTKKGLQQLEDDK